MPTKRLSRYRLVLLAAGGVMLPLVLILYGRRLSDLDVVLLGAGSGVISVLIVAELVGLVRFAEASRDIALASGRRMEVVLQASPVPIALVDSRGVVEVWNRAAERASGFLASEVLGKAPPLLPARERERAAGFLLRALAGEPLDNVEVALRKRDGEVAETALWTAPIGAPAEGVVVAWLDLTEQKRMFAEIEYLASHDQVTELPNRWAFETNLQLAVQRTANRRPAVLLLIDVDNLKLVNDSAGHAEGDRLLVAVARILADALRPADFLARTGGDEFAALLHDVDVVEGSAIAERMLERVRALRLDYGEDELNVTVSIGACPVDGEYQPKELYALADSALYLAKARGRNRLAIADQDRPTELEAVTLNRWPGRIREALREARLRVFLQPIVTIDDGRVQYFEALVRQITREGELVLPEAFLSVAERFELMPQIDLHVLETVVTALRGQSQPAVFVNLSATSFENDDLANWLEQQMRQDGLRGRLGLEITEATAIRDLNRARERLTVLRSLGCRIALDDFGVGFSSFAELKALPIDLVKISGSFTRRLAHDQADRAIVEAIVSIAHALGKQVVAEEIEEQTIAELASQMGIEYGQGFLWGKPTPLTDQADELAASA